jgi:hypothetical protein
MQWASFLPPTENQAAWSVEVVWVVFNDLSLFRAQRLVDVAGMYGPFGQLKHRVLPIFECIETTPNLFHERRNHTRGVDSGHSAAPITSFELEVSSPRCAARVAVDAGG